ncbi:MAG: hypothetical protein WD772_05045, partial [Pseudohongiellaceae bacterium]
YRRQGICSRIIQRCANDALESGKARTLVICAEKGSTAEGVYRRAGFTHCVDQHGVCRSAD